MSLDKKAESLLNKLQSKGASDVLIKRITSEQLIIRYAKNKITIPITNLSWELTIKLGYKNRYLITSISDTDFDEETYSEQLIKEAKKLEEDENYVPLKKSGDFIEKNPTDASVIDGYDKAVKILEEVVGESLNRKVKEVAGILTMRIDKIRILSSLGLDAEDERETVSLNHRCLNDINVTGQWACFSRSINQLNIKDVIEKSTQYLENNLTVKKIKPGKYDVIFSAMLFAQLMERVVLNASAFSVEAGFSFLIDKINEKIAKDEVTIYDDPTLKESPGYARFDDEGIRTYKKEIISKGYLKTYLHNLTTAKKFNTESTGNAGLIMPSPWTIIIKEGDHKEEELIKELKKGLIVNNSWYLRYQNYRKGDFSTVLRDGVIEIENGEPKSYLTGARLSENFLNLLNSIEALSKEVYPIKWWEVEIPTYAPYALVRNMNITTSEV